MQEIQDIKYNIPIGFHSARFTPVAFQFSELLAAIAHPDQLQLCRIMEFRSLSA